MSDGLFGNIYDAQLQDQLLRQKAAQGYGTGWEAITKASAGAGGMLGKGVSRAFGGMTPMEAKQAKINEIQQEFADADFEDPATFSAIGNRFMQEGFGDLAMKSFKFGKDLYEAQKPTSSQLKQNLLKMCREGDEMACRRYQAETAATEALAGYREARSEQVGVKTKLDQLKIDLGLVGLEGEHLKSKIASLDANTLKTLTEEGFAEAEFELKRRDTESKIAERGRVEAEERADQIELDSLIAQHGKEEGARRFAELKKKRKAEIERAGREETALAGAVGKDLAAQTAESYSQAKNARKTISVMEDSLRLLNEGVTTGSFADARHSIAKFLHTAGLVDSPEVANTDAFIANSAKNTLAILGTGELGAGTGLSDADREFAAKVAAASIQLDEMAVRRILEINAKASKLKMERHNSKLDWLLQSPDLNVPSLDYYRIEEIPDVSHFSAFPKKRPEGARAVISPEGNKQYLYPDGKIYDPSGNPVQLGQ